MKKIKKIKIKINGNFRLINSNINLLNLLKSLKIPFKKVAIELNQEIIDKKKLNKKILKKMIKSRLFILLEVVKIEKR